ncbi:MAG: cysteine desulfurase [Candidatus Binatia bacterium]|nr:cysteine desulfurase [Candidatus Binatia bacterium]
MIYLDYNATTPVRSEALSAMWPYLREAYGNPSSVHALGSAARVAIEDARATVAATLGVTPPEVIFTSGGTEANHLALWGTAWVQRPGVILSTPIEHSSVLRPLEWLVDQGWEVRWLKLSTDGLVDLNFLERALTSEVRLVSIGWANNEIGTIQPLQEIHTICRAHRVWLHTDAVQTVGKIPLGELPADLVSVSGHKFGGPKGSGVLVVRRGVRVQPLLRGGGQERGLRAGTENVAGIVGLAAALEVSVAEVATFAEKTGRLRDRLWNCLQAIPGVQRHGAVGAHCLPNTLMVTFEGVTSDTLVAALDLEGICVSAGSACAAGAAEPSHVLLALGVPHPLAAGAIRFSLGPDLTEAAIDFVAASVAEQVARIRGSEGTLEHAMGGRTR